MKVIIWIIGILLVSSPGCIHNIPTTIKSAEELKIGREQDERNKIFKVYDNNIPNNIILAYEKLYTETFDIAKNYLQYSKEIDNPTYDGFWIWLIKNFWYKDMFEKGDEFGIGKWLIDNRFECKDYVEIRKNYELFERMR